MLFLRQAPREFSSGMLKDLILSAPVNVWNHPGPHEGDGGRLYYPRGQQLQNMHLISRPRFSTLTAHKLHRGLSHARVSSSTFLIQDVLQHSGPPIHQCPTQCSPFHSSTQNLVHCHVELRQLCPTSSATTAARSSHCSPPCNTEITAPHWQPSALVLAQKGILHGKVT
jgi:hypothetical protein